MFGKSAISIVVAATLAAAATWYLDGFLPGLMVFAVVIIVPYSVLWLYFSWLRFVERRRKREDGGN